MRVRGLLVILFASVLGVTSITSATTVSLVPIAPGEPGSPSNPLTPPDTIIILVQTDGQLYGLDAVLTVASGPATIIGAIGSSDGADYGWDPLYAFDPVLSWGSAEIGMGDYEFGGPGVVGYFAIHCHEVGLVEIDLTAGYVFGGSVDANFYPPEIADHLVVYAATQGGSIRVTAPDGGEFVSGDTTYRINWWSLGFTSEVLIEYSTDNGQNWHFVDVVPNTGAYDWLVPATNSDESLVRVSDTNDSNISDTSDAPFTISGVIEVQTPNGGEVLIAGGVYTITWSSSGVMGDVLIEYSHDNGESWEYVSTVPSTGTYNWLMPVVRSDQCLLRITDTGDPNVGDISNGVFTIELHVQVPDVVELTQATAEELILSNSLTVGQVIHNYNDSVPEGDVISQNPEGETMAPIGSPVDLVVSLGAFVRPAIYVDDDGLGDPEPHNPDISDPDEDGSPEHPFDAIQEAVDLAVDGDVVIVRTGLYTGNGNRGIQFYGKGVTVRSEDGPHHSILDCENLRRGFTFGSGEDANSVLDGLTIRNGRAEHGGAIGCGWSSPLIRNCILEHNSANYGGAMHVRSSDPILVGCTFAENSANAGGAISGSSSRPLIIACTFKRNSALWEGGAIRNVGARMVNCLFAGNSAKGYPGWGGAIYNSGTKSKLMNCTVVGNTAKDEGGGMHHDSSRTTVLNCIFWGNKSGGHCDECAQIYTYASQCPEIDHTCIQGWTGSYGGTGNIGEEPSFVAPGYWDSNGLWIEGDFRLLSESSCIDSGNNENVPPDIRDLDGDGDTAEPIPWDLDGNPRAEDGDSNCSVVVDMGTYEYMVSRLEVPMKVTPQALNLESNGRWIKAHIVLPEEIGLEDVDTNCPARIIQPFELECESMNVFVNDSGCVDIEAAFSRGDFCGFGPIDANIVVEGMLTTGQRFRGQDRIKMVNNNFEYLAGLALYWLDGDCGKPDWCGGLDLDQDGAVDFADFALFDGCCIEVVSE